MNLIHNYHQYNKVKNFLIYQIFGYSNAGNELNNTKYDFSVCNEICIKSKIKKFKEVQFPIINRFIVSNEYNVCFIIDNTFSMSSLIDTIKAICHNLFVEIVK